MLAAQQRRYTCKKMNNTGNEIKTFDWWSKQRLKYNVGLIISGIVAFIFYLIIFWTNYEHMANEALNVNKEPPEITIVTIFFQGILYLLAIGAANIFYYIGPISEKMIKPKNVMLYRRLSYGSGFFFL